MREKERDREIERERERERARVFILKFYDHNKTALENHFIVVFFLSYFLFSGISESERSLCFLWPQKCSFFLRFLFFFKRIKKKKKEKKSNETPFANFLLLLSSWAIWFSKILGIFEIFFSFSCFFFCCPFGSFSHLLRKEEKKNSVFHFFLGKHWHLSRGFTNNKKERQTASKKKNKTWVL